MGSGSGCSTNTTTACETLPTKSRGHQHKDEKSSENYRSFEFGVRSNETTVYYSGL